jgi:hypothetical protein
VFSYQSAFYDAYDVDIALVNIFFETTTVFQAEML